MKRTGCLLLLAALLALWELHTVCASTPVLEPKESPAVCPPERYVNPSITNRNNNQMYCNSDANCAAGKMCCVDNQSKMCKPPQEERPGECPPVGTETTVRKEDFCTSDSECAPNLKCCSRNGGRTCLPSIGDKPGACEKVTINCFIPGRPACISDSECPRDEKCCRSGCGVECKSPLPAP